MLLKIPWEIHILISKLSFLRKNYTNLKELVSKDLNCTVKYKKKKNHSTFSVHINLLFFFPSISSLGVRGDPGLVFMSSVTAGTFLSPIMEIGWIVSPGSEKGIFLNIKPQIKSNMPLFY